MSENETFADKTAAEVDPRADYKRAFEIKKRFEKVVSLTDQILAETEAIKELMGQDFKSVARFEVPAVEELRVILKATFRRPIWAFVNRWTDNTIGRTESSSRITYRSKG